METRLPSELAMLWVEAMEDSDIDRVMHLYSPGATFHAPGSAVSGLARIRKYLRENRIGPFLFVEIQANDRVHIRWQRGRFGPIETALRVADGQIAEQWLFGPVESRTGEGRRLGTVVR